MRSYVRRAARPAVPPRRRPQRGGAANALARFVTIGSFDQIDRYRALEADLESGAAAPRRSQVGAAAAVEQLTPKRASAMKELARLENLQRKRQQPSADGLGRLLRPRRVRTDGHGATPLIMGGSWMCPVAGAHAFGNDYGDSRSGGRHHAGNDILATRGTPIVAPVAGTVRFRSVSVGGRSFFLEGVDGNEYFGTHLSGYEGGARCERRRGHRLRRRRRQCSGHAAPALRDPSREARHDQPVPDARARTADRQPIARRWRRRAVANASFSAGSSYFVCSASKLAVKLSWEFVISCRAACRLTERGDRRSAATAPWSRVLEGLLHRGRAAPGRPTAGPARDVGGPGAFDR